ncbi:tripartite tricarboxylate transporter TctB family protein [Fertoebacter nigrum]|uniref:Tripartite tricarboxylate transporter TctB family protein n=1 Tax=Fertoeibacter niger TaxID=2656921 RepID=A0A8X8KS08_9RHOB|nr:tripartite tricarboxylate transporter TctB family protein [Fertoeibacter niger]NUB45877.1 tripartite tricarboxylate transporter TctB family protein [Fertoeibacter niger]
MSSNRSLGAMALLMAATLAAFGWGLVAPFAYEPVGPRAFPMLTAGLIALCGVILLIGGGNDAEAVSHRTMTGIVMLTVTLLVYAVIFERLGYVPATFLMSGIVARIFGASWVQAAVSGAVLSVGSYLLFDRGLDVVLPAGILGGLF